MFRGTARLGAAWLMCLGVVCGAAVAAAAAPENLRARAAGGSGRDCGTDATILVSILTDDYGSETSWDVTENPGGTIIASGSGLDSNTQYDIEVCVDPAGCYDFTIYDSYGDGMCCSYGDGNYQVYYNGSLVGSGAEFGDSETVGFIGDCTVPTGACCESEVCTGTVEEASCGGTWYSGQECPAFACPGIAGLNCPDSLFSQNAHGAADSWSLGTSEVDAEGTNYLRTEHFSGVISPICDIHWWGTQMVLAGDWVNCSESDPTFIITFYADNAGVPGAVVQSYTVQAAVSPTNELLSGLYELKYFSVDTLTPCTSLSDGWVSIQGLGDTDCWFMWDSSPDGDGGSCIATDGVQDCTTYLYDNAVCLTGEYVASYGACCDDGTGVCNDGVEIINCTGRFEADTLCNALDPLCGQITGACCTAEVCSVGTQAECAGGVYQGDGTTCSPDPCACTDYQVTAPGIWTGSTAGSGNDCSLRDSAELIYAVDIPTAGTWVFSLCGSDYDTYLFVGTSCCGAEVGANDDSPCTGRALQSEVVASVSAGVHYVAIEAFSSTGTGNYQLDVHQYADPTGACCEGETCSGTTTEPNCAGEWHAGEDCATFTCPPPVGVCPPSTGFGQTPYGPDDDWIFGTAEIDIDGSSLKRWESYTVTESICDIHWWGLQMYLDPIAGWLECTDSNPVFEVKFYADAGGAPGAEVASYTVTPTIVPTGVVFAGLYEMLYYSVPLLAPCVTQTAGFVSIQGFGDTNCWFLWAGSGVGDGSSCLDEGLGTNCGVFDESDFDLSVCLTTEYTPTFGACCDDSTGVCNDGIEAINCTGNRFEADTLCADLDPPCGVVLGACCDSLTGECLETITESACLAEADRTWHNGQDCATFTCPAPPLTNDDCGNATAIGEVTNLPFDTGTATNDGGGSCMTSPNIWYDYLASCSGEVHVSLCGSSYDTKLAAYDGNSCNPLGTELDCNDDSPCTARALQSEVWITATAGNHYLIEVGGYSSSTGPGVLSITCPPLTGACCVNQVCTDDVAPEDCAEAYFGGQACADVICPTPGDDCTAPFGVTLGTGDLPYINNNTNCGRGDIYDDANTGHCLYYYDSGEEMIYELTITEAMTVKLTLDPHGTTWSGFAIGDACPPTDSCLGSDYHSSSDPLFIDCTTLTPGTYYIQVDTWSTPDCIPDFTLTIEQCAAGGACCDTDSNCTDVGSAGECADLYLGNGTSCATDSCPPGNDVCQAAVPVNIPDTVMGSTTVANNSGVETCGTSNTSADVWYSVIGNGNVLTAALCNTAWDTKISVFTDGCDTLTCVGGNDDSCYGRTRAASVASSSLAKPLMQAIPSRMKFKDLIEVEHVDPAKGGGRALQSEFTWCSELDREYLILVHGYSSNEGDFTLDIIDGAICEPPTPPENDDCADVTDITAVPYEDLGVDIALATDDDNVDPSCDSGGNAGYANNGVWYTYTPPEGCDATITVDGEDTIIAVWTGPDCASLTEGECSDPQTLNTWMSGGTEYWILVSFWYGYSEPDDPIDFTFDCVVPPKGACCTNAGCIFDTAPACAAAGGSYVGDDTACAGPPDCNGNGVIDVCDIEGGTSPDCNNNDVPDDCDIADGTSEDCQPDDIPDECQLAGGGRSVVLSEGFEGSFPPAGWENTAFDVNGPWEVSTTMDYVHSGAQSAVHPWSTPDYADTYLLTPVLDITTGTLSVWSLGCADQDWCNWYDIDVMIVIGEPGGGDDIFVGNLNELYSDYYVTWVNGVYDLTPLLPGGNFRIGFRYYGLDGDLGVLDDVEIDGTTGPLANDCNGNGIPDECDTPICGNDCLEGGAPGNPTEECDGGVYCTDCVCDPGYGPTDPPSPDCVEREGACCDHDTTDCLGWMTRAACLAHQPPIQPEWFNNVTCDDPGFDCWEHTGACCVAGSCTDDVPESDCRTWKWWKDTPCSDPGVAAHCDAAIPTLPEWGLMVLTLLVLTAGTVVFGRRRRITEVQQ